MRIFIIYLLLFYISFITNISADVIKKIDIVGNDRISDETIKIFGKIKINEDYSSTKLNNIIKNLYKTSFFEDIKLDISDGVLIVTVKENPIIQNVEITGVKNKRIIKTLSERIELKEKSSFLKSKVKKDEITLQNVLKSNGYYFSKIISKVKINDNNTVNLKYDIQLGNKAYIKNIKFIGDKKIKDRKLKNVIVSEENKFWKFISNKKFLDTNRIKLDESLLKNYYKNNGFYNVNILSTFAQIIDDDKFELVFNIDAGEKYYFNKVNLVIPDDFEKDNFLKMNNSLKDLENNLYSLNQIKKILDEVDKIVLQKQFQFINASYSENIIDNKINLTITIAESEKIFVEKINIFGNYITNENVIRNQIITDEGDPFNEILFQKSVNNIRARNLFSNVKTEIIDGSSDKSKILNIEVEEKATGEVAAGAGTGTSGSNISFSISENNYLGRGIGVRANTALSDDSITALLSITNPNFRNSDKLLDTTIERSTTDFMSKYGYKTTKTGFSFGTTFEQYQDIYFSPKISSYLETLDTSSIASAAKKKQEGDYFDSNFSYFLTLNKLNQNFQPSDGYKSRFFQSLPVIADDKSIINSYEFSTYNKLKNESIISIILFAKAINSYDDDVRVSKRIFMPARKLRGFAAGKIGPLDAGDYIGGNYGTAANIAATLPKFLVDLQNVDFSLFLDAANVFGVDYNDELDSSKLRSSAGVAIDWFTPIGPLSISFASPLTKASTDKTETFRFQLGTTF